MQLNQCELAWAAGFFDGEGWSSAPKSRKQILLQIGIAQTDIRPLRRFYYAIKGLGAIYGPRFPKNHIGKKPQWRWQAGSFEQGQAVIALLWKFLSEPKRQQATKVLNTFHLMRKSARNAQGDKNGE